MAATKPRRSGAVRRRSTALAAAVAIVAALVVPIAQAAGQGAWMGLAYSGGKRAAAIDVVGLVKKGSTVSAYIQVATSCTYTVQPPNEPPNAGYAMGVGVAFHNMALRSNGSFTLSGPIDNHTAIRSYARHGGTVRFSGRITGNTASGTFTRTSFLDNGNECDPIAVTWKATYKAQTFYVNP
jgi:hypothetical protein